MDSETKGNPQTEAERHLEQAYSFQEEDKFEDVLRECDAAIEIDPSFAEAHNLRGVALEELGRIDEAIKAYRKAVELDPEFRAAEYNLSDIDIEFGDENELVTIATFGFTAEAHTAKTILDREGITSLVDDADLSSVYALPHGGGLAPVKLKVRRPDARRAFQLLKEKTDGAELLEEVQGKYEQSEKCPRCQSPYVHYEIFNIRLTFLLWLIYIPLLFLAFISWLLRIPSPFIKKKWKCSDCGYEWE